VYDPVETPLLAAARRRGAVPVNGLGMLVHQAAHAFRRWTGEEPPVEVMSAAAVAALSVHR
jgi:shikimate dehydrogenase